MSQAQKIVEEVQRKEVTTGEILTIVALREALRIIEKQEGTNEHTDC